MKGYGSSLLYSSPTETNTVEKKTDTIGTTSESNFLRWEVNFRLSEKVGAEGVSVNMAELWRALHHASGGGE